MDYYYSYRRGDVIWANNKALTSKHLQKGNRPFIVIQNDYGNNNSPTLIVTPTTSKIKRMDIPTHVYFEDNLLKKPSVALLEQISTIDRSDILKVVGSLSKNNMQKIDEALAKSIGLHDKITICDEDFLNYLANLSFEDIKKLMERSHIHIESDTPCVRTKELELERAIFKGSCCDFISNNKKHITIGTNTFDQLHLHKIIQELEELKELIK